MKRISVSDAIYKNAVRIGSSVSGDASAKSATAGTEIAINQYMSEPSADSISQSIRNNIQAIRSLSKNANMADEDVDHAINTALKALISELMESQK